MQVWGTDTAGGFMYSDKLSNILRTSLQPIGRIRQFCDAKDPEQEGQSGLHAGDTFRWNIYSDVSEQGGALTETVAMPETSFSIAQASMTITEYGNSVPFSSKLDDLSLHPVTEIIQKALKNDANKALEAAAHTQFDSTLLLVNPTSGTSATAITINEDGTTADTNNLAMSNVHVKLIVDQMKERDIPVYDGDNYFAVGRPATFRDFKDDIEALHSYVDPGFQRILRGEVGRHYEGVRFFEQTTIASEAWSNGKSDAVYFFGEDTVAEAIVIPEEIRGGFRLAA